MFNMSAKGTSSSPVKPDQILVLDPSGELKFKGLSSDNAMTLMTTPLLYLIASTRRKPDVEFHSLHVGNTVVI